jgi:hypothetical protein
MILDPQSFYSNAPAIGDRQEFCVNRSRSSYYGVEFEPLVPRKLSRGEQNEGVLGGYLHIVNFCLHLTCAMDVVKMMFRFIHYSDLNIVDS